MNQLPDYWMTVVKLWKQLPRLTSQSEIFGLGTPVPGKLTAPGKRTPETGPVRESGCNKPKQHGAL